MTEQLAKFVQTILNKGYLTVFHSTVAFYEIIKEKFTTYKKAFDFKLCIAINNVFLLIFHKLCIYPVTRTRYYNIPFGFIQILKI